MAGERFSVTTIWKMLDRLTSPHTRMTRSISKNQNRTRKSIQKTTASLTNMGKTATRALGVAGVAGAAFVLTRALGSGVNKAADFEAALISAGSKFPGIAKRGSVAFIEMEKLASKLGATTQFTATQAAEGFKFLAFAGFDLRQSLIALPQVLDLATVAELGLAEASDIATDTLGAFKLGVEDLTQVNDVFAKVSTSTNTSVAQMFEVIKQAGASANVAGVSFEEMAAAMGLLAQSSVKASQAGTILKNVYTQLSVEKNVKTLRAMGVEVENQAGALKPLPDILEELDRALTSGRIGNRARLGIINQIFGLRGQTGIGILLDQSEALRNFTKDLENSRGTAAKLAKAMRVGLRFELLSLTSAWEAFTNKIVLANGGGLELMLQSITGLTRALGTVNPGVLKFAGGLAAILAVGLVVAAVVGLIAFALSAIAGSTAAVVAGVVVVITSLVALFVGWFNKIIASFDRFESPFQSFQDFFGLERADANMRLPLGEAFGSSGNFEPIQGPQLPPGFNVGGEIVIRNESDATVTAESERDSIAGLILMNTGSFGFGTP